MGMTLAFIMITSEQINQRSSIKFVNTSMHGVSDSFAMQAFALFGFRPYVPVPEQQFPDPEFPTVRFPNPEEKGK
jgi:phosphomannomutase